MRWSPETGQVRTMSRSQRRSMIDGDRPGWRWSGQCELELMSLIDKQCLRTPFWGSRKMTAWLRGQGHAVNRKRVQRLMRRMGIEAIYRRPRTPPDRFRTQGCSEPAQRPSYQRGEPGQSVLLDLLGPRYRLERADDRRPRKPTDLSRTPA